MAVMHLSGSQFFNLINYEENHLVLDILCPNLSENTAYTFDYLFLFHLTLLGLYIKPNTLTHRKRKLDGFYICSCNIGKPLAS